MPKKIARDIARQVRELGEEVIREGVRQPLEMAKEVGRQVFGLPRRWGEEGRENQISTQMAQEKEKERRKNLALARKRIKELTPESKEPPKEVPGEIERQRSLAKEAEKKKPAPEVGKKRKVPLGVKIKTKKSRAELGEWRQTG